MHLIKHLIIIAFCVLSSCVEEDTGVTPAPTPAPTPTPPPTPPPAPSSYLQREDWAPDVKQGLNDFIADCSGKEDAYVVFDFDNTTSIFDVEAQMKIYQLETMCFALTPDSLAKVLSEELKGHKYVDWVTDIKAAYSKLYDSYGPFRGECLSDSAQQIVQADPQWLEFATKLRAMSGKVGSWRSSGNSYNWCLCWFTGMTEKQVYDLSYNSHKKYAAVETSERTWRSPAGISSELGQVSTSWIDGIQVTENIRELWKCLDENGIDVWVCSASGLDQISAAVDAFGLHDYCTGVVAMTMSKDADGVYKNEYDYTSGFAAISSPEGWEKGTLPTGTQTAGPGKVTAIVNAIAPLYHGATPLAGFMDATGDFNFCTEFSSLRTVVCFNRADRKITDGGGLISEVAIYEKETLKYDYAAAQKEGNTLYLLQGRDENGMRTFRASNKTIRYGSSEEKLFANQANYTQLESMISGQLTVEEAINMNACFFLSDYSGYHSR